jgi:hypothetical protein
LLRKDAFFQPYLPLQQLDMLKETKGWLCGSTNSIVTQQKEIDLLVNVSLGFPDSLIVWMNLPARRLKRGLWNFVIRS